MNISVIIPTFNRVDSLMRALASVFDQDGFASSSLLEVIVVDDGSSDNTAERLQTDYPEVRYLYQENSGVSAARNTGIKAASGAWVALLDSDDEWLPHKLSAQLALLQENGLQVCHTEEVWIRNGVRVNQMKKHKKYGGWIFEHCLPLCAMSPSSIIINRSVFDDVGMFDESLPACEDYDLWLRIAARYEVAFIAKPCIRKYGGHQDQLSRQYWGMDRFRVIALEKCLNSPSIHDHLPPAMIQAAETMLIKKLKILLAGASKHNNQELADQCLAQLARWSH